MPGNIFGGGNMFGKSIPLSKPGAQANPVAPLAGQPAAQKPLGVVAPPVAPQGHAMGPNGPVPMGKKQDCPVCRG